VLAYDQLPRQGPKPTARGAHAVASSSHPVVTDTMLDVLRRGGNAADAGVAGCLVQATVEPHLTTYAGTVTCLYWEAASGRAYQLESTGTLVPGLPPFRPLPGGLSWLSPPELPPCACIPGFVPGLEALHARFGSRDWAQLCEPAIHWAEEGHPVTSFEFGFYIDLLPFLTYFPSMRELFTIDGYAPQVGDRLRNPKLAETARRLASDGPGYCTNGAWAQHFVAEANRLGWPITLAHLSAIPPRWQEPLRWQHRGHEVVQLSPPERTGVFTSLVLGMLGHLGVPSAARPGASAEGLYFQAHALRRADVELGLLNDPALFRVPTEQWLSEDYQRMQAQILSESVPHVDLTDHVWATAGTPALAAAGLPTGGPGPARQPTGSCELSVVDQHGNWLQLMNTLQAGGIPGVAVDGVPMYGCHAQANMRYFIGGWFAGGGRIRSPMGNTIVLRDGQPWLALGTPGNVFTTVPQVLGRILDEGLTPEAAIEAPRMVPLRDDYVLEMESRVDTEAVAGLARMGIRFKPLPPFDAHMGSFQTCWRDAASGELRSYADSRRAGKADGF
jgi:gamma-glutamyltranspeptidase/glutathione hydrolase